MKNKKILEKQEKITITFGYGLFFINIIVALVYLFSFGNILSSPDINRFNVVILLIFITANAILPTLISYIVGDKTAHAKNLKQHHYNGVLFGIAAYLLSMVFSNIQGTISSLSLPIFADIPTILWFTIGSWPIAATIAVMAFIAVTYNRNNKHNSMLQYRPYQLVLLGSVIGTLIYNIIAPYINAQNFDYLSGSLAFASITIIMIGISYKSMFNASKSVLAHIAHSIIAVTIALATITLVGQITYPLGFDFYGQTAGFAGLMTWVIYLVLMSRKS